MNDLITKLNARLRWVQYTGSLTHLPMIPNVPHCGHVSHRLMEEILSLLEKVIPFFVSPDPFITKSLTTLSRQIKNQFPDYCPPFSKNHRRSAEDQICTVLQEEQTAAFVLRPNNSVLPHWEPFIQSANAVLDRLIWLPYSHARIVSETHFESRSSFSSDLTQTDEKEESLGLPSAVFHEWGFSNSDLSSDDQTYFLANYQQQIVNSFLRNLWSRPIEIVYFYTRHPNYETALYRAMDPGENDYVGIVFPSFAEQEAFHRENSCSPTGGLIEPSITGGVWHRSSVVLQPGEEVRAFPEVTFPNVLKTELLRQIAEDRPSQMMYPPQGIRGIFTETHCAVFRFLETSPS